MKARVKYNNEIIDIVQVGTKTHLFDLNNVEFLDNTPDYWTRLEQQYAGMAMQGILGENTIIKYSIDEVCNMSVSMAAALVEKMKEVK